MRKLVGMICLVLAGNANSSTLEFKKITHSQISLTKEISSVFRIENKLYQTSHFNNFVMKVLYNPKPGPNELPFGSLRNDTDNMERIVLPKRIGSGYWRGIVPFKNNLMLLEGRKKKVLVYYGKDNFSIFSDIIIDRFIPAEDSRGKPTQWEIRDSRARFMKSLQKVDGGEVALAGIAPLPKAWGGKEMDYLVLTRIPSYPLFLMRCNDKDGIVCRFRQSCFVDGLKSPKTLTGIALSTKRRQLLISYGQEKRIDVFRFNSCFRSRFKKSISLPSTQPPAWGPCR